ncbi:hypothetical protein [Xylanimonas ulmi]|uniref:Siderophore-interacting protein n=1 Tax=Xylanimonas ulmi TaxID=228973 RepID=A0A4Q7M0C8_9MICO|nr:hypothetical protein [Xylanibacterium ulmi]RZS60794.1 hypothetical protein EV386_1074 [Xylanibacterium ulmi]
MPPTGDRHVLLAGDLHDIPRIVMVLEHSSPWVYGQIYLEVDDRDLPVARALLLDELPDGVCLTLLLRPRGAASAPGELLARALTGWVAEWASGQAPRDAGAIAMWVGFAASPAVDSACQALGARLARTPVQLCRD